MPFIAFWPKEKARPGRNWHPDTMPPGKTAIEALRLMEDRRCRHVPIVDGGKVVGIRFRRDRTGSPGRGNRSVGADLTAEVDTI
jgi:CBS domain-containing protein